MTNEEIRPRLSRGEYVLSNRMGAVDMLEKLIRMGYTEDSAREYVKTGDVDKLKHSSGETR